jgi:hypothetical protein
MRRLLRWTFNVLVIASLLLCLATAGLWVRSYWVIDLLTAQRLEATEAGQTFGGYHYRCFLCSYQGRFSVWFGWSERHESRPLPPWEFEVDHPIGASEQDWTIYWFGTDREISEGYGFNSRGLAVRVWSLVSAFAVLPAIFAFRQVRTVRRRRRRARLGLCPACGYDLRASPGRCPECGRRGDEVNG